MTQATSRIANSTAMATPIFGTARLTRTPEHRALLMAAIKEGLTSFETAGYFEEGAGEHILGETIQQLVYDNDCQIEDITIAIKCGVLAGKARTMQRASLPPDTVYALSQTVDFCLHPEFILQQLTHSLQRLAVPSCAVVVLDTPECVFAVQESPPSMAIFYDQLTAVLCQLEAAARAGKMAQYGLRSAALSVTETAHHTIALSRLEALKTTHQLNHFNVIQCPLNLCEPEQAHIIEACTQAGWHVRTDSPLNTTYQQQACRLVHLEEGEDMSLLEIEDMIQAGITVEQSIQAAYEEEDAPELLARYLHFFSQFNESVLHESSVLSFRTALTMVYVPAVEQYMELLDQVALSPRVQVSLETYFAQFNQLLKAVLAYGHARHNSMILQLKERVSAAVDTWAVDMPIEAMALSACWHTPGVEGVVLGMRSQEHITKTMALYRACATHDPFSAWDALCRC